MLTPLRQTLMALDLTQAPLFAVLDGAQFDDLPRLLFDGDFVAQPLYLDRGDNDPDQVITAPQMVWLDERVEGAGGRAPQTTLSALLEVIDDLPRAVFWQCAAGGEALYRHLRGINMVSLPAAALPADDTPEADATTAPALFRHADPNVLAQIFAGLALDEAARLIGPAERLICAPHGHWCHPYDFMTVERGADWPAPARGLPELSAATMTRIEDAREAGLRRWAVSEFTAQHPGADPDQIHRAYSRAQTYGIEEKDDLWTFVALDLRLGENFEHHPRCADALEALTEEGTAATARMAYAADICRGLA